jgi:signal transduction histidine kinase
MALLADEKGIRLRAHGTTGFYVEGDKTRLQQVIVNLIDNAIKYTQEGGKVEVSVSREETMAVLEVSDNGPGIPADCLPHVFDRFYRADKARSRASGGAGLGLSIVKAICAAHAAEVKVSSQPGQGTCFRVELPLLPAPSGDGLTPALRHPKSERALL